MLLEPTDNKSHLHCKKCDSDNRPMIKFKSPTISLTTFAAVVAQEDKREMRFNAYVRAVRP